MDDDSRAVDRGWDALPEYNKSGDADDAVTVSLSTTPGEWLVNTTASVVVPMSMAELVEGLRNHTLTERSLVWRAGMQEWAPVDKVPQLKLAARLPAVTRRQPPPKPVRATPASHSAPPQAIPSRKATLPFGLPTPAASQSGPAHAPPASARADESSKPSGEDTGVLAVYARPAATISFDLSPEQPLRAPVPQAPPPPQTLAPTTSDSAPRRAPLPPPRNADLSVVAASQFRQVQRSSKRLIWVSSLASAAAASVLTFWIARGPGSLSSWSARPSEPLAALPAPAVAPASPVAPPRAEPVAPAHESEVVAAASATPAAVTPPKSLVAAAKPKAPHKPKAVSATASHSAGDDAQPSIKVPSAEPNPYDVKLDDDAPTAKPAGAHGSGLEPEGKDVEASASSASTPGF